MSRTESPTKIGKGNTLLYALLVAAFLAWNTVSWSYDKNKGWEFKSKDVPLAIVTPCLVLMGVALGINLGGAFKAIADLAAIATRNSIAINALAKNVTTEFDSGEDSLSPDESKESHE